jgi:uncharacterized protein (TIGR02569 family)
MLAPPASVLQAFGATAEPVALEGGQGQSWVVGDIVLKPLDLRESELAWQADVLRSVRCDGFRVSRPVRSHSDTLVIDGWCAWERVEGRHEDRRWPEIIAAGERFHAALAAFPRPDFIATRSNNWSVADRVAWGEGPSDRGAYVRHLPQLFGALRPVAAPCQLVHADLTGNVLFADGLPPAIIDFSPYWRPPAYAAAIVVADALVWEGAGEDIVASVAHLEDWPQFLLRALIFRIVTDELFREQRRSPPLDGDPYREAVELACRRAGELKPFTGAS